MHELAAKFGALALSPFFLFGGHATTADHIDPVKQYNQNHVPAWQQLRTWVGGEKNRALAIKSIEGPSSLVVDTEGEWTLNVKSKGNTDLKYSVVWGDEASAAARSLASTEAVQSSATFSHTYESEGTYTPTFTVTDGKGRTASKSMTVTVGVDGTISLDSLSATSGAVGTTVVAHGDNFTASSTVMVGETAATNVTYNDVTGTLSFTVPSLATGTYDVRVRDGNELSNVLSFTITATTPRLSISAVDAPVKLAVGAEGTWTIHAATSAENLKYSVVWGDEGSAATSARMMATTEQTSATFTHAYETAGMYKPKFTVTDDSGKSATVSASIVVR